MPSSNKFRRVDEPDSDAITVIIWKEDDGRVVGTVQGPTSADADTISFPITPQDGSLTATEALDLAVQLSRQFKKQIVVMDNAGDWDPLWGTLT